MLSDNNLKLLILGYKQLRRGINYYETDHENIDYIEKVDNVLLVDNGDTIEGTPLANLYALKKPELSALFRYIKKDRCYQRSNQFLYII